MSRKKGFTRVGSLDEFDPPSSSAETSSANNAQKPTTSQDIMRNQSDPTPRQMLPAIYAVPTSDTFDDGSTVNRPILSHQTPSHSYSTHPTNGSVVASHSKATPIKSNKQRSVHPAPVHPPPPQSHSRRSPTIKSAKNGNSPTTARKRIHKTSQSRNQPRDFQFAEDLPSVAVRAIDLDTRSAYGKNPCPTVSQWKEMAHRIKIPEGKRKAHLYRRMSPSLQHLELLQIMQRQTVVRQLHFSPSSSLEADPFVGQPAAFGTDKSRSKRDGRYRPVNVLHAYINSLPETAPILSHRKTRLPTRADVGFPGATEEEIVSKQREISYETEWEEATPRLVVLVNSTDLGTTVEHPDWAKERLPEQHLKWNGGGLEGMPYCGKNLIRCFEQNAMQWGRRSTSLTQFLLPDPYSIFAPPLGATYSRSLGWRPRPFHDRLPGLEYAAVCPMKINLPVGDAEPLFCSIALYSLPNTAVKTPGGASYGRLSEEFWSPAGDWSWKASESDERASSSLRTHRAIFSYDTLALSANGLDSLFIVLKVFKPADGSFRKNNKSTSQLGTSRNESDESKTSVEELYRGIDTQILTPVCFGISSMYDGREPGSFGMKWPSGEVDEMDLLPFPVQSESEEAFVDRLSHMVASKETTSKSTKMEQAPDREETPIKKKGLAKMFRSPMKPRGSVRSNQAPAPLPLNATDSICGKATLFKSSLGHDFLESLLSEPQEIHCDKHDTAIPKLLSDPTGDNAVILRGKSAVGRTYKRSNLARMPNVSEAAHYNQVADSREVLGMTIRREKTSLDPPLPTRSLINLLYVLPHKLTLKIEAKRASVKCPTVRMRLVQTEESINLQKGGTKITQTPIASIYSKCPWAGQSIVESAFTTIAGNFGANTTDYTPNLKEGISFLDEFKVRLPLLIDGTYSLEFSLFDVIDSSEADISLSHIATANVPLSSSGTRDPGSGSKVATIIPNGVHRVKMGDFQLQLETRLVTPLHVPDPAVAVALRDFPFARHKGEESQGSVHDLGAFKSVSGDSIDQSENFPDLLSSATPASIVAHFPVLLYMHLCNLVNLKDKVYDGSKPGTQFMMGTMLSLFEMIRLAKLSFKQSYPGTETAQRDLFIKLHVDLFDETKLSNVSEELSEADDDASAQNDADSISNDNVDNDEEVAIRLQKRKTLRKSTEARVAKIAAELGAVGVPLSRSAYGASKTDRMRLQGEIFGEGEIDHYFDDDETVATMSTYHPMAVDRESRPPTHILDESSYQEAVNTTPSIVGRSDGDRGNSENGKNNEFANRMKSAAQSLLAPCVGQSLTNIILPPSRSGSPRSMELGNGANVRPSSAGMISPMGSEKDTSMLPLLSQSGSATDSDSDDEGISNGLPSFRGPSDCPILRFSASRGAESDFLVACGSFLYESIFLLWLRAWLDFIEGGIDSSVSVDNKITSFVILPESGSKNDQPIFAFFANLDFLLPICLKSIVMRYSREISPNYPASTKAIVDDGHLRVLEPFVEMLARGLMGQALAGLCSGETLEESLLRALKSSTVVNEFLAGLATVLHAEHIHSLLSKYFRTLRDCETEHLGDLSSTDFQWTLENLHRVRSSRQLRLQAIEGFSTMPAFIALNFPRKYTGATPSEKATRADWLHQYVDFDEKDFWNPRVHSPSKRAPPSAWLAQLLTREALSICSLSSESVVAEAMAHIEATSAPPHGLPASSALKKRPGATLKREDLLMFQSLSIQAITSVYELLIRRHVMDRRFQKESSRGRIAGMLAGPIFEKSLQSVRWLARMEATHRVRSTWCLVLVYVLQETPETLLTHLIKSYCDPKV